MMITLRRITKAGFLNFKRGGLVSFASVLVMTITLSVITAIILLQAVLFFSLDQIKNKVDVTIYFTVNAPEDKILALKDSIAQLPEVSEVSYVSAADALSLFRERHKDDYPTIQALDEIRENPLGAYLNVKAKEISQYEGIANFLKGDNALVLGSANVIDKVNYHQNKIVIDKLNKIISGAQKLGFLLTFILVLISIAVAFNTIRLAIFTSREEIGVMQLVGASSMRVQGPFMVAGAIYGIIATIITLFIFFPATIWLGNNMTGFLGINMFDYYMSNFIQISIMVFLTGILLGVVSSFIAVRKYLMK